MKIITKDFVKSNFPKRPAESSKGTFGRVLCVCGSTNMMGAALLCARGIYAAGAGYVTMVVPEEEKDMVFSTLPEAVLLPLENNQEITQIKNLTADQKQDVMVMGCGLGTDAAKYVPGLISTLDLPLVLDGDGLNALAGLKEKFKFNMPAILTPHPLEAARLIDGEIPKDDAQREQMAKQISAKYNAVCVLKGARTIVAYGGDTLVNETGSSALAKAGTGDVLAGLTAGIWAQLGKANVFDIKTAFNAAACAVYLHGLAGDKAAADMSDYSVMASDLNKYIGISIKEIL
ncbi:NAD(P)H-hydrate epimerase [Elusimicrobium simillimum]|uniref:NAD(P)H-hydrate dehydratase n=1 Tax=Elusimicrobium simillimum TaxID=3143438 RepID=UPI003C6FC4CF